MTFSINRGFTDAAVLHAKGANIPLWHRRCCPSNSALLTIWMVWVFFPLSLSLSLLPLFSLKVVPIEQDGSHRALIEPRARRGFRGQHCSLQWGEGPPVALQLYGLKSQKAIVIHTLGPWTTGQLVQSLLSVSTKSSNAH